MSSNRKYIFKMMNGVLVHFLGQGQGASCWMPFVLLTGACLSATTQTIADKLSSSEFRGFIRNTRFNYSLLAELKTTLFALQSVLVDAEQKQFIDLPVKQWLDDLKDAIFDAEDLLDLKVII
ncbi:hypothetical protein MTR_3g033160 [Medicago truncatula]|uniref:Disease resistance N-terminal domain-containing protein n=1 Tax=Medicago truncatula TaxID=3880 RepID=G7J0W1_MEDTR|nr:hypothetical protein MTR_3g033160 [Medicago truncatula]